jgi:ribosomal protein L20A (L18A)
MHADAQRTGRGAFTDSCNSRMVQKIKEKTLRSIENRSKVDRKSVKIGHLSTVNLTFATTR